MNAEDPAPKPDIAAVDRRRFIIGAAGMFMAERAFAATEAAPPAPASGGSFFDGVIAMAKARAEKPHEARKLSLPRPLDNLSYDAYRGIRVRPERRVWSGENRGFVLDLLPPGFHFNDAVAIEFVRDGVATPATFDISDFEFAPDQFDLSGGEPTLPDNAQLTYSGFRVRFPINRPDVPDEFMVFQGASYFRAVARNQLYGLSARGLAIGTGSQQGEEFPVFEQFWIHVPDEDATSLLVEALLDSPSVSGAYQFTIRPGAETVMEVRSVLFARTDLRDVGIAPLTSMFFFGPRSRAGVDDFREAAHDSSGLQIITGQGERIWRPLANPAALQFATFVDTGPKGFGLVQRQRRFEDFQDAEARYEKRPSGWVVPTGDWGPGGVVLVEIPSPNEFNDNIVAFWRPRDRLDAGGPYEFGYRLFWSDYPPDDAPLARVIATRGGVAVNETSRRVFVVDYAMRDLPIDVLTPDLTTTSGEITHVAARALPVEGTARVSIEFAPEQGRIAEFRMVLNDSEGKPASETWIFRWSPS